MPNSEQREVFICHAREDKSTVVNPLITAFDQAGISYWYDEAEIKWGDSITEKVNQGLRISLYVIVVLSEAFLRKKWPQRELNSALNIEASTGEVRVLPLLTGTSEIKKHILAQYPILNDKVHLSWDDDPGVIVNALYIRLAKTNESIALKQSPNQRTHPSVPLPRIKAKFTHRDKDIFLQDAFHAIKQYFQNALVELERHYQEVQTSFTEVNNFKFVCTIYLHGDVSNKCKIWLGGPHSTNAIAYHEGDFSFDNDNAFNDWLDVNDEGSTLALKRFGSGLRGSRDETNESLSPEKGAEYLWGRFTQWLNQY